MRRVLLLVIGLFIGFADAFASNPPTVKVPAAPKTLRIDSNSKLNLRHFNADSLNAYNNNAAFRYASKGKYHPSLWERFWNWIWDILMSLFGGSGPDHSGASPIRYVVFILVIIFLVYVIVKLLGGDLVNIFSKKSAGIDVPYNEMLENIHEINFDAEIEKAVAQRNFKLAVRLLYLACLKQLSDAAVINWQIEKTNSEYLNEINNDAQRQSFGVLTRQFEFIWYGNFPVDAQSFKNINVLFADFKKLVP